MPGFQLRPSNVEDALMLYTCLGRVECMGFDGALRNACATEGMLGILIFPQDSVRKKDGPEHVTATGKRELQGLLRS